MDYTQINKPRFLNLDKSKKNLSAEECFFLLNNEINNQTASGKSTPMAANRPACSMVQPAGENYRVGSFYSKLTNETYSWVYNGNGVHYIQRIKGNGDCEVVYHGCLTLSANPINSIEDCRAFMWVEKICRNRHGKQLIWTSGEGSVIGQLDVEAAIATNFFTTPFFNRCPDPCAYVQMCVPDPCGCLMGEFVPLETSQISLTNHMIDVGVKIIYRHIYYDGRVSIWSDPSTLFYQDVRGCFDNESGFPRCLKLRVPVGNPLVEKIEIGFSKMEIAESGKYVWYSAEVVEKYKKYNSSQQFWYERELSETLLNYSDEDCSFDYYFCNDKQCDSLDPIDVARVINPIPREAQALIQIKDSLGFINYKKGNCAIDKFQIDKFKIDLQCSDQNCPTEFVEIKVRAIVHNQYHNRNQFIYRLYGTSTNSPDDPTDPAYFGGLNKAFDGGFEYGYDQRFEEKTRNFIAYIEGTDYWAEMKQFKSDPYFTNLQYWGTIGKMSDVNVRNRWRRATRNGEFFYQEATIKVPKGTRGIIRLASHHATGNEQDTSTFVIGVINNINLYRGDINVSGTGVTNFELKEIYVEACDALTVDLPNCFLIGDNAVDDGFSAKASAYNGYIKDLFGLPVEGVLLNLSPFVSFPQDVVTDHNGFYCFYIHPGDNDPQDVSIEVERDCVSAFLPVQVMSVQSGKGVNTRKDEVITDFVYGYNFFAYAKIKVKDCDGNGVGGIRVALSGSKYKITDALGVATFKVRNYRTRDRGFKAIVLNNNGCFYVDCNDKCSPCMPLVTHTAVACYKDVPTIIFPDATINRDSLLFNRQGLKSGGRYPFAFVVDFGCGKMSAVNEVGYYDIPKTQEKNKLSFCQFSYNGNGITFPPGAKCLKIVRGENVNPFELQWVIDKIEKTDDGKIKLTIQSLNDYNERFLFKTNTIYQWLKNDRIEFLRNGDGKIFTIAQFGLLNYLTLSPFNDELVSGKTDSPADFFNQLLIEDDGKLDGLTVGAVIEIQRAKQCITEPTYYSICVTVPIGANGKLLYDTGVFNTFDTYIVNRIIGTLPSQPFEHHSPSDFWGERLSDIGRAYFVNKYENERRYGRNISLNSPIQFNRFGDLEKTFDAPEQGDITAAHIVDGKIILAIGEHDSFLAQASNDLLRAGSDGLVRAASVDSIISDAEAKLSGTYGCQYSDIGSVFFGDGYATWVDNNKHRHITHDYSIARVTGERVTVKGEIESVCNSYFTKRCQEKQAFNNSSNNFLNHYRWCVGFNKHTQAMCLTLKSLRHSATYNESKPYAKPNDTILINPASGNFLGFASFTAEGYSQLNLFDGFGCAMISYFNGIPYIHPMQTNKFNEFFGISCDWVIGIALNKYPEKIKRPLSIEEQSQKMFFVSDVTTEQTNFRSEIPAKKFTKEEDKWNGAFLSNINSRGGLYGDAGARGYHIGVTFIRDNTDGLKYGTIDPSKRLEYSEIDEILFKFSLSEQAGFTENV